MNTLKAYKGDKQGLGVTLRLTDLEKHVIPFNLRRDTSTVTFSENLRGWRVLERSGLQALFLTLGSTFKFGGLVNLILGRGIPMDAMAKRRPDKRTDIFDSHGMIDEGRLAEYLHRLRAMATPYQDEQIPQDVFMAMLDKRGALDSLTRKQWASYFRLLDRAGRKNAISPADFEGLYRNTLIPEMFDRFARA